MAELPKPVTNVEFYLAAVLRATEENTAKLDEIRCGLIDVETALEKLATSPTQKTTISLDVKALADKITASMGAREVQPNEPANKPKSTKSRG